MLFNDHLNDFYHNQHLHVNANLIGFPYISLGDIVLKPTWGRDQPNNYNGEQNCVVLDGGRNWLWNDVGCNLDYLHFICQHGKLSLSLKLNARK